MAVVVQRRVGVQPFKELEPFSKTGCEEWLSRSQATRLALRRMPELRTPVVKSSLCFVRTSEAQSLLAHCISKFRQWRHFFSRGEWTVRWLKLPRDKTNSDKHGLVIVQIDGLAHAELESALASGRMPFLKSLLDREHYRNSRLYSGLPSSTPAVQGELFYRKRCAVPAFGFRDRRTKKVRRMFDPDAAADVQQRLADHTEGLLAGGSSYCNIYDGGAVEAHFCASSLGWGMLLRQVHPWRMLLVASFYSFTALRTVGLLVIELALALFDFARGFSVREFWQELLMIPGRVVIVILMRELAINGAIMDTVRGLPTIYLNLLGYDEQAHRRQPDSRFARWTLKGIDAAIRRLRVMAQRATARHYDVWIISDHGQEKTTPYLFINDQEINASVEEAVHHILGSEELSNGPSGNRGSNPLANDSSRAAWLSAGWLAAKLFGEFADVRRAELGEIQVAALGPIGHVYLNRESTFDQRVAIAKRLVVHHGVPLALVRRDAVDDVVFVVADDREFVLPYDREELFADHPFKSEVCGDLRQLCCHPDAGEIVLSGWAPGEPPISFPLQNGAHAGFGPNETSAFALLPSDVPAHVRPGNYLRPEDLHDAAKQFLAETVGRRIKVLPRGNRTFRVMTYNVHGCLGMDGLHSPKRIARVIAQAGADVIALQELDVARARSGHLHQVEEIARHLEMEFSFHPAWEVADEKYGNAVLSRFPMRQVKTGRLPTAKQNREPRSALWVEIDLPSGQAVQIINTHLSIYPAERFLQAQALLSDGWMDDAWRKGPAILLGDFNAMHNSRTFRMLAARFEQQNAKPDVSPTWPSTKSLFCIDHLFTSIGDFKASVPAAIASSKAAIASDHLPLFADLTLARSQQRSPQKPPRDDRYGKLRERSRK